jgi:5-methylcytosine-specific restriction protein A
MSRPEFSKETKRKAWERAKNHCEASGTLYGLGAGQRCNMRLDHGVEYDHILACSNGGDASLENCAAVCPPCHRFKSSKIDTPRAAKSDRQFDSARNIKSKHNWGRRPLRGNKSNVRDIHDDLKEEEISR